MLADFAVPDGCAPAQVATAAAGAWRSAAWLPAEIAAVARALDERGGAALAALSLERRLAAWEGAVAALLDPDSDERQALLPALIATARLSPAGLSEALEVVLGGWRGEPAAALAGRAPAGGSAGLGGVVLAGNVPGLAAQVVLPALLAGRPLLLKSARREPLFAPALVAALAGREPALGGAFAALTFAGTDAACTEAAFAPAERVLAYGSAEALAGLSERLGRRLVAQGPKASVALVGAGVDPLAVGRALARDVALLDQRGCLSVHAVYIAGDDGELAETLAYGLALESRRLPPGPFDAEVVAVVQQWRGAAALEDRLVGGLELADGTVIRAGDGRFRPSPGLRTVRVHAVARPAEAVDCLTPWAGKLQGAALAGEVPPEIAAALTALGISRLAPAGALQAAGAGWANGGIDPFTVFG